MKLSETRPGSTITYLSRPGDRQKPVPSVKETTNGK